MYGKFITLEGIDGAGKSTHLSWLGDFLKAKKIDVVVTREPGGTSLGERLRELLLHEPMHAETEALLMFAARREHIEQAILPNLRQGTWVISDRFTDASFAYQGGGRGLDLKKLAALEEWVHPNLQPDLTLLFDVAAEVGEQRIKDIRVKDRFEQEKIDFFKNVRNEYLRRAAQFPQRIKVIDGSQSITQVQAMLEKLLDELIHETT